MDSQLLFHSEFDTPIWYPLELCLKHDSISILLAQSELMVSCKHAHATLTCGLSPVLEPIIITFMMTH